jgi:hypothetical protein
MAIKEACRLPEVGEQINSILMAMRVLHFSAGVARSALGVPIPRLVRVKFVQLPLQLTGEEFTLIIAIKITIYVVRMIPVLDE